MGLPCQFTQGDTRPGVCLPHIIICDGTEPSWQSVIPNAVVVVVGGYVLWVELGR
jgi:hypothetical protein